VIGALLFVPAVGVLIAVGAGDIHSIHEGFNLAAFILALIIGLVLITALSAWTFLAMQSKRPIIVKVVDTIAKIAAVTLMFFTAYAFLYVLGVAMYRHHRNVFYTVCGCIAYLILCYAARSIAKKEFDETQAMEGWIIKYKVRWPDLPDEELRAMAKLDIKNAQRRRHPYPWFE
jgi:cytochrome bd-type quinol oxidase subunit 2